MRAHVRTVLVLAPFFAAACGTAGSGNGEGDPPSLTYHQDVRPILEARCSGCHADGGIGPYPLTTYEEVHAARAAVAYYVQNRIMPPWLAADGCSDYAVDVSLTDEQIETIVSWATEGEAPAGDPADFAPLEDDLVLPVLDRVDLTVQIPVEYTPPQGTDDYRCFVIEWPGEETQFVTGYRANPGNPEIVHHIIAFAYGPDGAQAIRDLEAADPVPGYECFGTAGGDFSEMTTLGAWAPGGGDSLYPEGTGIRMEPGSVIALQVHYNTHAGSGSDLSSMDFQIETEVEREGAIVFWANPQWLGNPESMLIPAGDPEVTHSFAMTPVPFMSMLTGGALPNGQPFVIHSASLHMHQIGVSGYQSIRRQSGAEECLLDVPRWDFHWQGSYGLKEPVRVESQDQLFIECHYDNSLANQPRVGGEPREPRDLGWGDGTYDEMCLGIFYVSAP